MTLTDRFALFLIALLALLLPMPQARADILADFLGWILKEPESTAPAGEELWPKMGDDGLRKAAYRGG